MLSRREIRAEEILGEQGQTCPEDGGDPYEGQNKDTEKLEKKITQSVSTNPLK